jgi:SAM-dependent methyltransferase
MRESIRSIIKKTLFSTTGALGLAQPEQKVVQDSDRYWKQGSDPNFKRNSHWRGESAIADDEKWFSLGHQHLRLYRDFTNFLGVSRPMGRVIEWGCGGGANAVHFARDATEFVGVEVSEATLAECGKQLSDEGLNNFVPVLVDVANPEHAVERVKGPCDFFLSTYVFELIPSQAYGERLLRIAEKLLVRGGLAMIQIKYATSAWETRPRRWGYRRNLANTTTYRVEDFWMLASSCGLVPKAVTLVPEQPLVGDVRYAYFLLVKE